MDPFKINPADGDELDKYYQLEDELIGVEKGRNGGGKSGHKGPKTSKEISDSQRVNAEKKRKEKAEDSLKRELQHSPFRDLRSEKISELVDDYSNWVLKSLETNEPYLANLDGDIKYTQSKSSGPGGQNVNKTSTAVTVKHLLTGIFSRSEDSREVVVNKRTAFSKLFEKLDNHIKDWKVYLKKIPKEKRQDEIKSFMKNLIEEKLG